MGGIAEKQMAPGYAEGKHIKAWLFNIGAVECCGFTGDYWFENH